MSLEKNILKYDHSVLQALNNEDMSANAASKYLNVPRTTLIYKYKGKYLQDKRMGPSSKLTLEEENLPVTKQQLLHSVAFLVKQLKYKANFKDGKPGKKWFRSF